MIICGQRYRDENEDDEENEKKQVCLICRINEVKKPHHICEDCRKSLTKNILKLGKR